jgi:hypothetical protein
MPKYHIDEYLAQSDAAIVPNLETSEKALETDQVTDPDAANLTVRNAPKV